MIRYLACGFWFLSATLLAQEPKVVCADIPPFAYVENGKAQGFAYELGQEIMHRLSYRQKIEIQPLARAFNTVQSETDVIALWLGRIPDRENTVVWIAPILRDAFSIYTLKNSPRADSIASAKKIGVLGANIGAANAIEARNNGLERVEMISSDDANGRKLLAGRIAGWITLQVSADFFMKKHALPPDALNTGIKISHYEAWMVASRTTHPDTIAQWKKTWSDMLQDGSVARIANKYRIQPVR